MQQQKRKEKYKMTKQTKKATAKKQNKKATAKKEVLKTFLEYTNDGKTIHDALLLTRATRQKFLAETYERGDFANAINTLANKYGYSKKQYDYLASYPLKADIDKIQTIAPFENKTRETLTPRMVAALVVAYLNRDEDGIFSRVFPCGLFLENGCLTDLLTGGFIKSNAGEEEKQSFAITEKASFLFNTKEYKTLEDAMTNAGKI